MSSLPLNDRNHFFCSVVAALFIIGVVVGIVVPDDRERERNCT